MHLRARIIGLTAVGIVLVPMVLAQASATQQPADDRPVAKVQHRRFGHRVRIEPSAITVEDGDGVLIRWDGKDTEIVRILGIDTPEVRRLEHNLPYDQPFGPEARAFAQGAFAAATEVELLRSPTLDPYGRTLAYLFINGRNFSVMTIKAGYSGETVSHYGDNGLPREAAEILAVAKSAAPTPFELPHLYRARMRTLTNWLNENGQYPKK